MPKKISVKLDKSKEDWVAAIYCDYGTPGRKTAIRLSYSMDSAKNSWNKFLKFGSNNWRCWQEDKKGNVINEGANQGGLCGRGH